MSRFSSPSVCATVPASLPSAACTFQPFPTTSQETGSATSDHLAADVPDRALGAHGLRVGEHPQDARLARDSALVQALEAASHHPRRRAVAELARAAEAEARRVAVAGWV